MKKIKRMIYVLLLSILPLVLYADDKLSPLPSEESKEHIKELASPSYRLPTRDWWSQSRNGGPPGSGTGDGGAVGISLSDGTLPVLTIGMLYILFIALKRIRKIKDKQN